MSNQYTQIPVPYAIKNINASELLGGFSNAARESGWTAVQLGKIIREAKSGGYENLKCVLAKYCVATNAPLSFQEIMENAIAFSLSSKSVGAVEGHIYKNGEHLLTVTNPETLAAGIFAMGECKVVFLGDTHYLKLPFPVPVADYMALQRFANSFAEAYFFAQFAKSSWFDFLNPHPADNKARAGFHLAEAVSHLPQQLIRNGPSSMAQNSFTEESKPRISMSPFAPD